MGDYPRAVNLVVANSRAHPGIGFFAVGPRSADSIETVAERYVVARGDA